MEKEYTFLVIVRSIKVSLKMGKDMVRVSISISMVIFTKENGEMEREKDKELFLLSIIEKVHRNVCG